MTQHIALFLLIIAAADHVVNGFVTSWRPQPPRGNSIHKQLHGESSSDNDDDGGVFYDDFGDFDSGSSSSTTNNNSDGNNKKGANLSSLKSRMSQVKSAEDAYDAKLARNWRRGNWSVRGFALDKASYVTPSSTTGTDNDTIDAAEEKPPAHVSAVVAPTSSSLADISLPQDRALSADRTVAVGRTDGSVFVVKLGDEYLTSFVSVPKLVVEEGDEDAEEVAVRVENEWMNSEELKSKMQDEQQFPESSMGAERDDGRLEEQEHVKDPFVIRCQFLADDEGEAVHSLVYDDTTDGVNCHDIICTAAGSSGDVKLWSLPSSSLDRNDDEQVVQTAFLDGVHSDQVISLQTMTLQHEEYGQNDNKVLFSACCDGTFALWDLDNNGSLIVACQCTAAQDDCVVTCADVSNPSSLDDYNDNSRGNGNDVIVLGTSTGHVVGYAINELLSLKDWRGEGASNIENPSPSLFYRAHGTDTGKGEAVTAIKCGGGGTILNSARLRGSGNGRDDDTGSSRRGVSSFILLTGGEDGLVKQWEILSQKSSSGPLRMDHWPRMSTQRMKRRAHIFNPGHDGPVSSIAQQSKTDSSKFITCGKDGSVSVWSASSGEELSRMDGFESNISSLACLGRDLLVTDGMEEYVCVNDFAIDEDAASDGYDLDW